MCVFSSIVHCFVKHRLLTIYDVYIKDAPLDKKSYMYIGLPITYMIIYIHTYIQTLI